jgi:hypothetical protein
VRKVLEDEVNPAIAAHRGHVRLVGAADGRVNSASRGLSGLQPGGGDYPAGYRTAPERAADIVAVVDVTDHAAGTEPFYTPEKR